MAGIGLPSLRRTIACAGLIAAYCIAPLSPLYPEDADLGFGGQLYWQALESLSWLGAGNGREAFGWETGASFEFTVRTQDAKAQFSATPAILGGSAAENLFLRLTSQPNGLLGAFHFAAGSSTPDWAATLQVQKAYVSWTPGYFFFSAGRQAINWGKARFYSPADLFAKMDYSGLVPARTPVDAVRTGISFGDTGKAELVALPASSLENGKYGGRISGSFLGIDAGVAAAREPGIWHFAADMKTDLILGISGELLYSFAESGNSSGALEAAIGLDYSLGRKLSLSGEFYITRSPSDGIDPSPVVPGNPQGQYWIITAAFNPSEILGLSGAYLGNTANNLVSANAAVSASMGQGIRLGAWIQYSGTGMHATSAWAMAAGAKITVAF